MSEPDEQLIMSNVIFDRGIMPDIKEVVNLTVPRPTVWHLSNGTPVYETNLGTQEIIKLELVFLAGRPFEKKKLAARCTPSLMKEGTQNYSSAAIAETMDFYGATLSMPFNLDTANVLLYSLTKHFEKVLPILSEVLSGPTFPQKEFDAFVQRNQQRLQVELTKSDVVAYRKFTELLFGSEHPYGYNSIPDTYSEIKRNDIVSHFEDHFTTGNCRIFLSGKITGEVRDLLERYLGKAILPGGKKEAICPKPISLPESVQLPATDKLQKAIRIGQRTFPRTHPDFNGMYVLNTILGGYFGSRLMANIREDKGYTYSIYSSNDPMLFDGYFSVASEVGNGSAADTVEQIYHELQKLQNEPVPADELAMVKNYLLGTLLTNLDGPFNIAEVVKTFVMEDLPISAFDEMARDIKNMPAETLQQLANRYFKKENMWEVIV